MDQNVKIKRQEEINMCQKIPNTGLKSQKYEFVAQIRDWQLKIKGSKSKKGK